MARGWVLVTGASTGIGEATTARLAGPDFRVLAGVRKQADAERIASDSITPVILDVTDAGSIAAARETVEQETGPAGLAGLVNNAGIAVSAPIEFVPIEELRAQLEVNLVGQVAVTQAMLPLVRAAQGRIVNVSSIGGVIAMPLAGPYAASKFGLEAVSDSLRREVRDQGIAVVVVEPGGVKTPIWKKGTEAADAMLAKMPPEAERLYGRLADAIRKETQKIASDTGMAPSAVAEVVATALTSGRPRTRYLVGRDAKLRAAVARRIPDRAFDALLARALS